MKNRLAFLTVQCLLIVALLVVARAFADAKRPQIGLILGASPEISRPYAEGFLTGMRELGYVNGKNVTVEIRYAEGQSARYPALVRDLLARHVDVLVVTTAAVRPTKEATRAC